jgi:hypothetical protein
MKRLPNWQKYERMIARLAVHYISTDLCVTPNARIPGKISGRSRQIDAVIDARHDTDNTRRIIIDAKKTKRKIDVTDVEAFQGLMEDVGATHGFLVCPAGHTKAAEKRAQEKVLIRLVPLDEIPNFDPSQWPPCENSACKDGRVFWDGFPALALALRPPGRPDADTCVNKDFVHFVGKCDRCGRFHVFCTTCGDMLAPPEHDEADCGHQCRCRLTWFWIASIEEDDEGNKSAELHVVYNGTVQTVDRRPS